MVVRRLQRQSFVQPIGVVRANAGGELVGQAIANFATERANEAFRKAGIRAEKIGTEAAASLSSEAIVSIDPETNQPVRYTPPAGYGEIAATAYQNMIKSRFESSVQKEIQRKGTEFAASSGSAAKYRDNMSSYIDSMYNADGDATPYSRYITEYGQEYVQSTYTTLAKKEAEAARKALITSEKIRLAENELSIKRLIAAGTDPNEIRLLMDNQVIGYEGLLEVDGMTATQYSAALERTYGLNSMLGSNRLIDIYTGLSDQNKAKLMVGIRNPTVLMELSREIGEDDLNAYVLAAKTNASIPSIISAIKSYDESVASYEETVADSAISDLTPMVNPLQTLDGVIALAKDVDPTVQASVIDELTATWITQNLDIAGKTAADIDVITNALRSDGGVDYNAIKELIGGERGQAIVSQLKSMSSDERSGLADTLDDRQTALNRIEDQGKSDEENRLRSSIGSLSKAMNVNSEYRSQATIIRKSSLDEVKKSTLLNLLDEAYTEVLRSKSKDIQLSVAELQVVSDALNDPASANFELFSPNAKKMYDTLKVSNDKFPALTRGFVDARITAAKNVTKRSNDEARLFGIESNLSQATDEDLAIYQEAYLGDVTVVASEMMSNRVIVDSLNAGVVLPKVADALEAALDTFNEKDLRSALQVFDQYSGTSLSISGGGDVPIDMMREALSEDAYAKYKAISYVANRQRVEPLAVATMLRNYDGNIDADIKEDLELPKSANLNKAFNGRPMSPKFKQELLAILRVRKAYGETITEDTVNTVIKSYTKGMTKDDNVFAPNIEDKHFYGRRQYFGTEEIIRNREALADAMEQSGIYNHLLTGGTVLDTTVAQMGLLFGAEFGTGVRAVMEQLGAGSELSNRERASDMYRERRSKRTFRMELAYKPIMESFNVGQARYMVGYEDDMGSFQPIEINGQPWVLEKNYDTGRKADLRLQSINALNVLNKSGAGMKDAMTAQIAHFATLEHFDEDLLINGNADYARKIDRVLGTEEALEIFRQKKKEFEGAE